MLGTDEQSATPDTSSSKLKPWKPRNSCTSNASSSDVRSAEVAMRQWSSRSRSAPVSDDVSPSSVPYKPMTVCVLPTSMANSIQEDTSMSSPMSSTGAELVTAPTEMQ